MTIKICQRDFSSLLRLVERSQTDDSKNQYVELLFEYPKEFGEGYILNIRLRKGFWLTITNRHRQEYLLFDSPEWEHSLQFRFHISGNINSHNYGTIGAGGSAICGSGMASPVLYESGSVIKLLLNIQAKLIPINK